MDAGDRLLLFMLLALLTSAATGIVLTSLNVLPIAVALDFISQRRWEAVFFSVAVILLAARVLYATFVGRKPHSALVSRSDLGNVSITLPAIENLVRKSAGQIDGVREAKPVVGIKPDGVRVEVRAWVLKDASVPELAGKIQETLRRDLGEIAGLNATVINVEVQDVGPDQSVKSHPHR